MSFYTSSFTVNYIELICNSSYLNPKRETPRFFDIDRPWYVLARTVAFFAITVFISPVGACYNAVQSLRQPKLFRKYAHAAKNDFAYTCVNVFLLLIAKAGYYWPLGGWTALITIAALNTVEYGSMLGAFLPPEHLKQIKQ